MDNRYQLSHHTTSLLLIHQGKGKKSRFEDEDEDKDEDEDENEDEDEDDDWKGERRKCTSVWGIPLLFRSF